jgi:sec-independent protein translocase protein TatC
MTAGESARGAASQPPTSPPPADPQGVLQPAPDGPPTAQLGGVMPLVDHLTELRRRIVWSVIAIAVGAVIGYFLSEGIISFLTAPLPAGTPTKVFGIGDAFAIRLKISLVVGVILAMPVILWHLWRFVSPGLTPTERRTVLPWIPVALVFFVIGVTIAYVILPFASAFLLGFQTEQLQVILDIRSYFDFVTTLFLAFGILMEFPILLVGLSRVGIVTSERLRRSRRYTILGIAIFSAVVTPGGDLVSPTVLGFTLYILFEVTTFVIRRQGR